MAVGCPRYRWGGASEGEKKKEKKKGSLLRNSADNTTMSLQNVRLLGFGEELEDNGNRYAELLCCGSRVGDYQRWCHPFKG